MRPYASAILIALVALAGACVGPLPDRESPVPNPSVTTASVTSSASPKASVAPVSPPLCLADADVVGWDEPKNEITLCAKNGSCVALGAGTPPRVTSTPSTPLADVVSAFHPWMPDAPLGPKTVMTPETMVTTSGARVQLVGAPQRWAKVPFSSTKQAQLLWLAKDRKRALILRIVSDLSGSKPSRDLVELVDLSTHVGLAHAEVCNYEIHTEASVDDAESAAWISFGHANPIVITALVDLAHARFVELGQVSSVGYDGCGPDDFGKRFLFAEQAGIFDATRRRIGRSLVSFDGNVVARLEGDFPDEPFLLGQMSEMSKVIDESRRVVVRSTFGTPKGSGGPQASICAGVMQIVAASSAGGAAAAPRCLPRCGVGSP